jgi:hypothetical protein
MSPEFVSLHPIDKTMLQGAVRHPNVIPNKVHSTMTPSHRFTMERDLQCGFSIFKDGDNASSHHVQQATTLSPAVNEHHTATL